MQITLEQARRLFKEANGFEIGVPLFLDSNSEIRQLAKKTFGHDSITVLRPVVAEIFRVIAEYHMMECEHNGTERT